MFDSDFRFLEMVKEKGGGGNILIFFIVKEKIQTKRFILFIVIFQYKDKGSTGEI